ncbi:MAG: hypothetical protein JSS72_11360 [Armatimonadetes bacterium]|nr:hypothetical protein [Armatimonadota bacterium]
MLIAAAFALSCVAHVPRPSMTLESFVREVRHADYAGDTILLDSLYLLSDALLIHPEHESLLRYWRGFALWRKGMNGMNDNVSAQILMQDFSGAVEEFEQALRLDPTFPDAKIAEAGCLMNLAFLEGSDQAKVNKRIVKFVPLLKEAEATDPSNPRLYWVKGPMLWYLPESKGGGQARAFAAYEKGLRAYESQEVKDGDSIYPAWGKPELLMNVAWSKLNATPRQFPEAKKAALQALKLVPYWHYLKDILLPQIRQAEKDAVSGGGAS